VVTEIARRHGIATSLLFATLVGAWMFRYETGNMSLGTHRNRFTGAVCYTADECWFASPPNLI
jgi:hypothetical protein